MLDISKIREDFPILKGVKNGHELVYLDSAATSQKPLSVIDAVADYYKNANANIHRGLYDLSEKSTEVYEAAKEAVADFINSDPEEIIFTRNATESINLVSHSWARDNLNSGDNIVLTLLEHHSNIVPWQMLRDEIGVELRYIDINDDGTLRLEQLDEKIDNRTKLLAMNHISNSLGTVNDIDKIIKLAKQKNIVTLIDACQSAPHISLDVRKLDCDFLVFSGHKMLAPMGIGILYGKKELLSNMRPFLGGGDMIKDVTLEKTIYNDIPWKFEAGTPNVGGAVGLMAAIDYLNSVGVEKIHLHEKKLTEYAYTNLNKLSFINVLGPNLENRAGIISFTMKNTHPHDVATMLNEKNIAVRAGKHCTHPLMERLSINSTIRMSFYLYNTEKDIDVLIQELEDVYNFFN